jgi:single-strand DNA-binding protein
MSKDLNMVQLTGNLGKDPETKYTPQGSGVTKFSVAASRRWRTAEGEDRADTEWFNVVAWNKLDEICAQYLQKGSRVYIEGRLQTRSWDDQQTGQKRYMTEVIANDLIMLDARRERLGDAPVDAVGDGGVPGPAPERERAPRASQGSAAAVQPPPEPSADPGDAGGLDSGSSAHPAHQLAAAAPIPGARRDPVALPPTEEDDVPF